MKSIVNNIQYNKLFFIHRHFILTLSKYQTEYRQSLDNKIEFWNKAAKEISWNKECSITLDDSQIHSTKWFVGSQLNMCYNCVDRHVEEGFGDQTAVIYDSPITGVVRKINYKQLQDSVSRLAGVFAKHGVRKGDRILIYLPMIPESLIAMLSSVRLGAIHSVIFGGFAPNELSVRIRHCEPKLIVTTNIGIEPNRIINYADNVNEAISLSGFSPKNCIIYNRPGYKRADLLEGRDLDYENEVYQTKSHEPVPVDGNHPLYIIYTSGSTGVPKGAVQATAGFEVALKWYMKNIFNISVGETFWGEHNLAWIGGNNLVCYGPLLQRCTTIIYEGKPVRTPDASQYFRVLNCHNPVTLSSTPSSMRLISREDPQGTLSGKFKYPHLRNVILGGENCDIATLNWARKVFQVPIQNLWGQTELGGPITYHVVDSEKQVNLYGEGHAGQPFPGYEFKIMDTHSDTVLGPNEMGRLVIKLPLPPNAISSLYKNDKKFRETYLTKCPGYFDTMDIGMLSEQGELIFKGRDDDILKISGIRISTNAITEVCLKHKSVVECVVIGLKDSLKGHIPLALVVLDSKTQNTGNSIVEEIIDIVREQIGPIVNFRNVLVVNNIPKIRSGKIPRSLITAMANGQPCGRPYNLEDPMELDSLFKEFVKMGLKPSRPDDQ